MIVFGGYENISVKRSNFVTPALRVRFAVLMHYGGHRLIEERQFVILDVDNFKLRVVAAFQEVVCPLCDGRSFPPRSRTSNDDSNLQHFIPLPFWRGPQLNCGSSEVRNHFLTCSLLPLTLASWWLSLSAARSPSFLSD